MIAILAAAPVAAKDPILNLPIDCVIGDTCYIQHYVDRDGGPGAADFTCGLMSYDTHKGTDFALPDIKAMEAGVNVLAAAPGRVVALRDGMKDVIFSEPGAPDISERECGNGLVIDHGGGWQTQYCHMAQGSVTVQRGQRVGKGYVLGQVGLSGKTEFPHLHLRVRKDGTTVDPFDPDGIIQCGIMPERTLWQTEIPYTPGGVISVGVSTDVPGFAAVKSGTAHAARLSTDAPALVVWGYFFGPQDGDKITLQLVGPKGEEIVSHDVDVTRSQATNYRAAGLRLEGDHWPEGRYVATVELLRDGQLLGRRETVVDLGY